MIVRPDSFKEVHLGPVGRFNVAAKKATVIGKGETWIRFVAVEFGGPEALSKNETLEIAAELTARRMKVQRVPRSVARIAARVLAGPNDALATVLGLGLMQDPIEMSWDDQPLRERGIVPRPASEFLREQARLTRPRSDGAS